ncbi:protein FAR1-RELATED SEQUENCE 5-like [Corylus avellana]|uniref:protein FAR1-RELATED SEQUENCE 5-like n=1 Tax=Corylus avellana TaxID=13451 RepID=UPI00286D5B48|nr:protein FAR1-RELATED SEQUENCE 5-like [Corylus avellana]XP_059457616.1 protein FAR1-RELATED SEQUENCE 5-like [Corylus avellana]
MDEVQEHPSQLHDLDNDLIDEKCVDAEMIEDQNNIILLGNDLKQPNSSFSSYNGPLEPRLGLEFDEVEDARICYNAYARRKGFSIRKNHTRLSKNDKLLIGVDYVCSREGIRRTSYQKKIHKNSEPAETRIGCKAMMSLKKVGLKWTISKFEVEHNHELLSPKSTRFLRGHRVVTPAQKSLIDTLNESGVPPKKIMSVLSKESGGDYNIGYIAKDVENYLGNKRSVFLGKGDAQRMYNYFLESQSKNPSFFFSIDVDENGCMGNCFWADARSRAAYQYFGDAVTFDASYLTNRYKMPFVPFTGVNHHHQSVMFGCALLVNETVESYTWLLKTWLKAMLGRAPFTIITDDDKAMGKAIAEVLPNTTHRLCLWHILQKVPEHLAHIYNKYSSFQVEFNHCIHSTLTIEEFETEWRELVGKYGVGENDWLNKLYMRRAKWVPAYLRNSFCAGMSTTQRSESINKFFKDYVRSSTMVRDFVHQYEKALDARYLEEKEKDVKTKTSRPILKTCYKMEVQAANVYTRKSFLMFQEELFNSQKYNSSKHGEEGGTKIYRVAHHGTESPFYEVTLEILEKKVTCTCRMFEFVGILCRHILQVFLKKSIMGIPQHYVLERWTINAKSRIIHGIASDEIEVETQNSSTLMKNSLKLEFDDVVELGSHSKKRYEHLSIALQKLRHELLTMDNDCDKEGIL